MSTQLLTVPMIWYEARAGAREVLGDRFEGEMKKFGETIKFIAFRTDRSTLSVAKEWATEIDSQGTESSAMVALIIMAAALELLEPTRAAA